MFTDKTAEHQLTRFEIYIYCGFSPVKFKAKFTLGLQCFYGAHKLVVHACTIIVRLPCNGWRCLYYLLTDLRTSWPLRFCIIQNYTKFENLVNT